jgi:hypothetical protein
LVTWWWGERKDERASGEIKGERALGYIHDERAVKLVVERASTYLS